MGRCPTRSGVSINSRKKIGRAWRLLMKNRRVSDHPEVSYPSTWCLSPSVFVDSLCVSPSLSLCLSLSLSLLSLSSVSLSLCLSSLSLSSVSLFSLSLCFSLSSLSLSLLSLSLSSLSFLSLLSLSSFLVCLVFLAP